LPPRKMNVPRPLPKNCTFAPREWQILAQFWHPVALGSELTDKPLGVTLLDERLVVYRSGTNVIVAKDLCLHRGARLSLGWVQDGDLVCGFHGFRYGPTGACVGIPAHPGAPISSKLCLTQYPAVEQYGLIWTCLGGEAMAPLPDWSELNAPTMKLVCPPPSEWNVSVGRHIENFNDVAHLSWVHIGTFGHRDNPAVERYQVEEKGYRLSMHIANATRRDNDPLSPNFGEVGELSYQYDCDLPFASKILLDHKNGYRSVIFDVGCPVSAKKTRIFRFFLHNYPGDMPVQHFIDSNEKVLAEDLPFVESQCPEDLPIDLRAEIHIPADRLSVEYRRKLAELGLGPEFSA
jgi:phenylpropionate dioxygenase-like ring-hydroxylating dioxygenase large terminal subunit